MKEDLCAWYQMPVYEEVFGPKKAPQSQQKKKHIDTCTLISAYGMCREAITLWWGREPGESHSFFNKCNLYLADNMNLLWKFLTLSKDQGYYDRLIGSNGGDFCCCRYSYSGGSDTSYNYFPGNRCDYYPGYNSWGGLANYYGQINPRLWAFTIPFSYEEESGWFPIHSCWRGSLIQARFSEDAESEARIPFF